MADKSRIPRHITFDEWIEIDKLSDVTAFILRVGMFIAGIIVWVLDRFHDRTHFVGLAAFIVVAVMLIAALIGWVLA